MIAVKDNQISNLSKIYYIEGTSDSSGIIDVSSFTLPDPPDGYENLLISVVYFSTTINA